MSSDTNSVQRSGGATSYNDLRPLAFLDKDMVEDVQH